VGINISELQQRAHSPVASCGVSERIKKQIEFLTVGDSLQLAAGYSSIIFKKGEVIHKEPFSQLNWRRISFLKGFNNG